MNFGAHVHLDFETYSRADLRKIGSYAYAQDRSTRVLACSYSIDGGPVTRWRPGDPYPFRHINQGRVFAWNAQFERNIWRYVCARHYGWPDLELHMFICVAAMARMCALPGKLENAARILDVRTKKDMKGHNLMLQMCKPRYKGKAADGVFHPDGERSHHTPDKLARLEQYCDDDVRAEMDIFNILPEPDIIDLQNYWNSERINDSGLPVDTDFAKVAVTFADEEKQYFGERLSEITGGEVTAPSQHARIKEWVAPRLDDDAYALTLSYENGVKKMSMDKPTRENLILEDDLTPGFLDDDVREFVEILDQAGKSTISKFKSMLNRAVPDSDGVPRLYGLYIFCGAAQSGRFSSVDVQVHNLLRLSDKDPLYKKAASLMDAMVAGDTARIRMQADANGKPVPAIHTLSKLVRPTITGDPHGRYDLAYGDYSAIEACTLPWLSNDARADERLNILRSGQDIYRHTADKLGLADRQTGKVVELACGYGGGEGSFQAMAKVYGVKVSSATAKAMVKAWRKENTWAVDFWDELAFASVSAVRAPGVVFQAGRLEFRYESRALGGIGALWLTLPSGRRLCYPGARIDLVKTKWGGEKITVTAMKAAWTPKEGVKTWPRVALWHGLLAENPTQAVATGCLLCDSIDRGLNAGLDIIGHTHDEIIIQTNKPRAGQRALKEVMETPPSWADGLPLRVETGGGYRYKVA